jgi:hypothetical protein
MANVKISALPVYTGTPADLRWFVMNNSGETETFKFSGYSTPLRYGDGTNSVIPVYYTSSNNTGQRAFIFGGTNNTTVSNDTAVLAGNNHSIATGDDYSVIIGGDNNDILATSSPQCSIIGGSNNSITTKHNGKGYGTTIVGSLGSTIGGASDNTANFGPGIYSSVSAENNGYFSALIGTGNGSGSPCKIRYGGDLNNGIEYSVIAGGVGNEIGGLGQQSFLGGGQSNLLQQRWSTILGGQNNQILDAGGSIFSAFKNSAIIGGQSNTINQKNNVAMLACSGRTATISGATFVENLVVFNYSNLNYADDTAAAAGGVVLGQVYHNSGALRIRIV